MKVLSRPRPCRALPATSPLTGQDKAAYVDCEGLPDLPVNWRMSATGASFSEVRLALSEGQFQPYFQPIFGLGDNKGVMGAEALLRWDHPRNGVLRAVQFLTVVEEADLLVDADVMTVHRAAADMVLLDAAGGDLPCCWVNASVADIFSDRFMEAVGSAGARAGLRSGHLGVEVPQVLLAINETSVLRRLTRLRDRGVAIAVERFGPDMRFMGWRCPLDAISLDPELIGCLGRDPSVRRMVSAVIKFAHGEGTAVIAKCVEETEQYIILQDLGCDGAQGYLFGEPVPATTLLRRALAGPVGDVASIWWG